MIDLAYGYAAAAAFLFFVLWRSGLWARWWTPLALTAAAWVLLVFYPMLFDFRLDSPCEGPTLKAAPEFSYFDWRYRLEAGGTIAAPGLSVSPRTVSVPWWYPETDGDESNWSGGVSFRCHAPLGVFTREAAELRLQPGIAFRLGAVAGTEVTTREEAARLLSSLPPGAVKATIYSSHGRDVVPLLVEAPGTGLPPAKLLHLGPDGVPFFEPSRVLSLLYQINDRKAYSVADILAMDREKFNWLHLSWGGDPLSRPPGSDQFLAFGFVLGPRLFRFSPVHSMEATLALALRMLGLHGHGVLGATYYLPDQWYLLPLRGPLQIDYIYFRLASLLVAAALALAIVRPALKRAKPALMGGRLEIAMIFFFTVLVLLNDTYVLAQF